MVLVKTNIIQFALVQYECNYFLSQLIGVEKRLCFREIMSYCEFCWTRPERDVHRIYHDQHYGFPIESDVELFGRLILEISQAGLSWETILKKQNNIRDAFSGFDPFVIAVYNEEKIEQLLLDKGIIRNRLKIRAVIHNAREVILLKEEFGSFRHWLDSQSATSLEEWVKLFKRRFKFVGKEIVNEFLMSTGYLPGAHRKDCPVFDRVVIAQPKWLKV
jgi:DNA-3-methyladenine glycosylase I